MRFITTLILFIGLVSQAQNQLSFKLIDSETKAPIAFANVVFNDSDRMGTISDIDGIFNVPQEVETIFISYIGYKKERLQLAELDSNIIPLQAELSTLDEVVITNTQNPAHRIIKNAIANKALNNPENLNSFTYQSYDKIIIDSGKDVAKKDSLNDLESFLESSYFFITETVAKRKYLKPRFDEDSIIATKSSGFKSPNFALLANNLQPFSFYEDYISLFEVDYLNPISKGSTKKYKFSLREEYLKGKDTIFAISFEPNANRNFEGLEGLIYINSNNYAVQSVDAKTYNSGKIEVAIQQKYALINNSHWFPEQLNFVIAIGDGFGAIKYVGKSYLSQIELNAPLKKKQFAVLPLGIDQDAVKKDDDFWKAYRQDSLNMKEARTYVVIDSLGEAFKFDKILSYSESLAKGRLPFPYVDLDLLKIFQYNKYEGLRLGAGFYTNDDVLEHISIGAFAGYGFKDHTWKYGGEVLIDIPSKKDISVNLKYESNLKEVGRSYFEQNQSLFDSRSIIADHMDQIKAFSISTKMKLLRNIDWSVGFSTSEIKPLYNYQFRSNSEPIINYTNSEVHFSLNYFVNEKLTTVFNQLSRLESDDPIFNLTYARGIKGVFGSELSYNKLLFTMDDSFRIKGLGKTTYRFDMGYLDTSVPYGQLFTGEGSFDSKFPYVFQNYFQTVKPYEFLSDRYVHLFTNHNLGMLLNNKGVFTPEIVIHNNLGIGHLEKPEHHEVIDFNIKNELFLETGLELRNLIKLNYLDIGYLGIGAGGFYRYGFYSLPETEDNLVFKFAMGFTFK